MMGGRSNMISRENNALYLFFNASYFTLYGLVKYIPAPFGDLLRYLVLKFFLRKLKTLWIKDGVTIWFPNRVQIGRRTSLNEYVVVNGAGGVTIGNNVLIGHRTSIVSDDHCFDHPNILIIDQEKKSAKITIMDNVFIGCCVTILPGVTIEGGAVIGAGSVVTKNVPANTVVAGNPARILRQRGTL